MLKKFIHFLKLNRQQKKLVTAAFKSYLKAYFNLLFLDVRSLNSSLTNDTLPERVFLNSLWALELIEKNIFFKPSCLVKSLAFQTLIRKQGYDCKIHLGCRRDQDNILKFHAWIKSENGTYIGDPEEDKKYKELKYAGR